ncbi:hypothetical protein J2S90_000213 [Arthrobacter bambusae]|uniref:Uncharacterized protein n=1 Tax=Arthrobacter bambusae TaxID=1338426 RepID=A0AAW8DF29_9MICC|nr:hypothetical protein [Arthrobacter bambusae]MDQ0128733.1 hypothetical protein [Arthrobacter bambusae]MDQ0180074.1 hypothetical protein [Arthrobacter bambusae]
MCPGVDLSELTCAAFDAAFLYKSPDRGGDLHQRSMEASEPRCPALREVNRTGSLHPRVRDDSAAGKLMVQI